MENYLFLKGKEKICQLTKNFGFFTQKIVTELSEIWLGAEIRDPENTYPGLGSKGQKRTRSQNRIRNTVIDQMNHVWFFTRKNDYLLCNKKNRHFIRVSDWNPHGSALIWVAGSGYTFKMLIRIVIRIQASENDPQK
jgi:hypothetical protein